MAATRSPSSIKLPQVAIVGAGVAGLVLAHGLQMNGFKVTIYEREKFMGERIWEWTMIVHWALPTFRNMLPADIFDKLPSAHAHPFYPYGDAGKIEEVPFFNGVTGEPAFAMKAPFRRMSRTRLRRVLCEGLDIKWGVKVVGLEIMKEGEISGPVKLILEADGGDGVPEEAAADLVIGADGSSSKIRQWLVGKEAGTSLSSEWVIGSGIAKFSAEQARRILEPSEICAVSIGPGGLLLYATDDVKVKDDPGSYSFQMVRIWRGQEAGCEGLESIRKMKDATSLELFKEPFYSAIQSIPEDSKPVFLRQLRYWPTIPWDNRGGRVTLIGDAAHCILPNRGQGLNHALNDVDSIMAQLLKVKEGACTIQDALAEYEAEMIPRGNKAALESIEDSNAVMTTQDFKGSRQAQKGLAK